MSKSQRSSRSKFTYTPTTNIAPLSEIKTEWDLKKLYYTSDKDPRIDADVVTTEKAYAAFARKWRSKPFANNPKLLAAALQEFETLSGMPEASRPGRYFGFRSTLNASDQVAEKNLALLSRRLRKASDLVLFFALTLGKLPVATQRQYLAEPTLAHYRYYLERLFIGARHHLSEAEEKIINLKARQSYGMWTDMTEKIISSRAITYKGKTMRLPEALETVNDIRSTEKPILWNKILDEMEQIGEVAEHEFNAIISDVRTEDELRGYKKPYSATAQNYEDTEKSIESLVEAVSTKGFSLSKKFYKLKAAYHGVPILDYSQKYDTIGEDVVIPFADAVEICRDVFYNVKPEYGKIFDTMLTRGQIDVFPKPGKRGGAFMSEAVGHPTHVCLNHLSNFKSLETLAHEMGHAIHAERGKYHTPFYQGHSITTAETASTLFENLVFDAVFAVASPAAQTVLLHDRIARDISTIERQIAFFNAELEIHNTIQAVGAMSNDELRAVMQKHLQSYLGPAIRVTPRDGYSYVYIPHLRFGFYVYTYAFGLLMSTIMANRYKADRSYIAEIDAFLSAAQSDNVANIFKSIGIDTTKTDTFTEALKNHEADIQAFGKLVAKR